MKCNTLLRLGFAVGIFGREDEMWFPDALKAELRRNPNGTIDFKLGPLEVNGISLARLKAYSRDRSFIQKVLSICVSGREVMFAPAHKEPPAPSIDSLQEVEKELRKAHEKITGQFSKGDKFLASLLLLSADDVHRCWRQIKDTYDFDRGVDNDERILDSALMAGYLAPMRVTIYHLMSFMINLLPPDDPFRPHAEHRLREGLQVLERDRNYYKLDDKTFRDTGWQPHSSPSTDDAFDMINRSQ